MFTNKNRPFYKSAFLYTLNEIPKKEFVPYIVKKFSKGKKTCLKDAAEQIYELARGYPYYVQKLSSLAWDVTKATCTRDTVQTAYTLLIRMEAPDFEGVWSGLTLVQKGVLKAMAVEPTGSPYAKEYLERHGLSIGGAQKAISVLFARDLIEKDREKQYRLTDPIMGVWLSGTEAASV